MDVLGFIEGLGVVPVVVIEDPSKAVPLAKALIDGGIPCAEVTFRTAAAAEAMKRMSQAYPDLVLGAGTVVTVDQAVQAMASGARFLVSPGYDQVLVDWAKANGVPYFPGVSTASEVQVAVANGFEVLKFFPAEACGGVGMIKNLCGPFPKVRFMTTGGISMANIAQYAASPNVVAVGGSWMVKSALIEKEDWSGISKLCREARLAMQGFSVKGFGASEVCLSSYNVERALAYLESQLFLPETDGAVHDQKGRVVECCVRRNGDGLRIRVVKA